MKTAIFLAAGALLGASNAKVHRMPLKKIPLDEQLVRRLHTLHRASAMLPRSC
jgi:hypothetical protein